MACNCGTKKEIEELYKRLGDKSTLPDNPKFKDYFRYYVGNTALYLLMLITFPIILIHILALVFWREDGRLHVQDFDLTKKFIKTN